MIKTLPSYNNALKRASAVTMTTKQLVSDSNKVQLISKGLEWSRY